MKRNNVYLTDSELEFLIWACAEIKDNADMHAELRSDAREMWFKLRRVYLS